MIAFVFLAFLKELVIKALIISTSLSFIGVFIGLSYQIEACLRFEKSGILGR
jgi:hypothetical protein